MHLKSKNRISKLIYGQIGFLEFLKTLFGLQLFFNDKTAEFNFYFSLKEMFKRLERYPNNGDDGLFLEVGEE